MSFHLERLTIRLQSLASKSELAELTRFEAAVRDEQSARLYVHSMYRIAKRWGIESLCETFPFVNEVFFEKESPSPQPEAEPEKD